jgi:hypothetical protein
VSQDITACWVPRENPALLENQEEEELLECLSKERKGKMVRINIFQVGERKYFIITLVHIVSMLISFLKTVLLYSEYY